jgi:hypothetical protein
MKIATLALVLVLAAPMSGAAQSPTPSKTDTQMSGYATALRFQGIMASRPGDQRVYVLLGSGFLRPPLAFGDPGLFVSAWQAAHPAARITPISRAFWTNRITRETDEVVYIWVEDGEHSLNVDMVRAGLFPGGAMYDMVDNLKGFNRMLENPKLADLRSQIEKERAAAPQDRIERLISEDEYKARIHRIDMAEAQARSKKRGVWSAEMKDDRESAGYP